MFSTKHAVNDNRTRRVWLSLLLGIAVALACGLAVLTLEVAYGDPGEPTVDGLYTGDEANYTVLGTAAGGRGSLYFNRVGNTLYLLVRVSPNVNDNVFGDNQQDGAYLSSVNWNNHNFKHLMNSDHAELSLQCGSSSWNWFQDYLYDADGDKSPTENDWLSGPNGPDGGGTPPAGLTSHSSLQWNMNNSPWDITLGGARTSDTEYKSPDPKNNYPNFDATHQWEWALVYEMSLDVTACGNQSITVAVPSAHNSPSKDTSENVPICTSGCSLPATIGDWVWQDQDANGIQNAGEPGISGVKVNLYKDDGDGLFEPGTGDTFIGTQNTDGSGNYLFTNLPAGDYFVEVDGSNFNASQPLQGLAASPKDQGSDNSVDSDGATASPYVTDKITLPSGADDRTWDFGYHCTVAGNVSAEVTVAATGAPLEGFTVNLYQDLGVIGTFEPITDTLLGITTTNGSGIGTFPDQAPGYYVLQVPNQGGYTFTPNEEFVTLTCAGAAGVTGFGGDTPTAVTLTGFNAVARGGGVPLAMPLALSGITLIAVGSLRMRRRQA